ncbi:MAG: pyruvate kinase alpha/beta domain-containing protein [Nitrososphaerales archaeon]
MTRYFEKPGSENTLETLILAKQRALELGIKHLVVATRFGDTALKAAEVFQDTPIKIVAVCHQYGYAQPGKILVPPETQVKLKEKGVSLITQTMVLTSYGKIFRSSKPLGNYPQYITIVPTDIIADTLRMFCQGMKVCVEIVIMAADSGAIPVDKEVISVAGTSRGADTAIVIKPAHLHNIFDIRIREIIAKPRV